MEEIKARYFFLSLCQSEIQIGLAGYLCVDQDCLLHGEVELDLKFINSYLTLPEATKNLIELTVHLNSRKISCFSYIVLAIKVNISFPAVLCKTFILKKNFWSQC